jgi:hypothetical protein
MYATLLCVFRFAVFFFKASLTLAVFITKPREELLPPLGTSTLIMVKHHNIYFELLKQWLEKTTEKNQRK